MSLIFSSSKGIYWYEKYGCLEIIEVIFMLLFNRMLSYAEPSNFISDQPTLI